MKIFLGGKFISILKHAFFISFTALLSSKRISLLLCDFYLKIKKNKTNKPLGITRLITVVCLCPSILDNSRMQNVDHMHRRKHLGAADLSHPADLSHVRNIG
jgi:hypothetical protein